MADMVEFVLVDGNGEEIGPFEMEIDEYDYYNMSGQDRQEQLENDIWDFICDHEARIV